MAIYASRKLKVQDTVTVMDQNVIIYRGNRNIYIHLTIENLSFGVRNLSTDFESFYPSHAYITLLSPIFEEIHLGMTKIEDDMIILCITEAMVDDLSDVGDYTMVIDLYDQIDDSLLTLPPIENQIKVRDRITSLHSD